MPLPALLRYDIWLAWRHLRAAFSKPGDVAIAVIGIPLLLAVLVKATENFVTRLVQMPAPIAGAVALAIALLSADAATARLTWHRTGSVMAAKAYPGASMIYLATLLAPVFALCAWSSLLAVSGEAPLHAIWMVSGLSFGLLSAKLPRRISEYGQAISRLFADRYGRRGKARLDATDRRARILDFVAGKSCPGGMSFMQLAALLGVLGFLLAIGFGATTGVDSRSVSSLDIVAVVSVAVLLRLAFQNPSLYRYLCMSGIHPMRAVIGQIMLAGVFVASTAVGMSFFWPAPAEPVIAGAAILFVFAWFSTFRAYNYATKSRLAASTALQAEIIALAVIAWVALPAVVVFAGGRVFMLERNVRLGLWKVD